MTIKRVNSSFLALAVLCCLPMMAGGIAKADAFKQGKQVAFDRKEGNCLACRMIEDGEFPGNIGPPLVAMKARFPDRAVLHAQIWNATEKNPNSFMPPFGKHRILTEKQVDLVTEYVYTL